GHPRVDHPHDHRRHRGRRVHPAPVGRPVGCGWPGALGLDPHHPRGGPRRRSAVLHRGDVLMDRRAIFFLGAAAVCAAVITPTESQLRWVPTVLTVIYVLLALVSYLDWRSSNR